MKKMLFMLAACLLILASCEPDPVLSLDKETLTFDQAGGSATVSVTANNDWTVLTTSEAAHPTPFVTVSPTAGTGVGFITVNVDANLTTTARTASVTVTCTSRSESVSRTVNIRQDGVAGKCSFAKWKIGEDLSSIPAGGCTVMLDVESNADWTLTCNAADVQLDKKEGPAGQHTVTAVVGACPKFEGREMEFSITCTTPAGVGKNTLTLTQDGGMLLYGGEVYQAVKMKDGKWWMVENLRYVPAGMTPSDDLSAVTNGIWYPLVIDELDAKKATVKFSKEAADIKANGYLYNTETALGLKTGELTAANCKDFEGKQGICPEGWHIPTRADIIGLVGKTADKGDTNPNAPYFDPNLNGGNGSVALLNAGALSGSGFNAGAWGAVAISSSVATKGVGIGAVKSYQKGMNTGYLAGSSLIDTGKNLTLNEDGSLKNCQFVGFMPNMNQGTFNGAWNNYRNGVSVRCVKDN